MTGELTTGQVAEYLGVKVQTIYAYVSRGVLTPVRKEPGTGSLFRVEEVQALVGAHGAGRRRRPAPSEDVRTTITELTPGGLAYRGVHIADLASTQGFEQVRELLTGHSATSGVPSRHEQQSLAALMGALPPATSPLDRFKHAVLVAAATDPGRHDRRSEAVARVGRRAAYLMALSLPGATLPTGDPPRLADTLATALPECPASLLDLTLVLLADHDLAVSTTAVRVAVSSGADPYSALLAGLAAADSPHHMGASRLALDWLDGALRSPQQALDAALTGTAPPPGFGHLVYTEQDPRAQLLLDRLREDCPEQEWEAVLFLEEELATRRGWVLNIDLALALLVRTQALPRHAGPVLFACARTAGWTAHALEELAEPSMRFRLRGIYSGQRRTRKGS